MGRPSSQIPDYLGGSYSEDDSYDEELMPYVSPVSTYAGKGGRGQRKASKKPSYQEPAHVQLLPSSFPEETYQGKTYQQPAAYRQPLSSYPDVPEYFDDDEY